MSRTGRRNLERDHRDSFFGMEEGDRVEPASRRSSKAELSEALFPGRVRDGRFSLVSKRQKAEVQQRLRKSASFKLQFL